MTVVEIAAGGSAPAADRQLRRRQRVVSNRHPDRQCRQRNPDGRALSRRRLLPAGQRCRASCGSTAAPRPASSTRLLGRRIEQWLPITPGSHYFAGPYSEVWSLIGSRTTSPIAASATAQFAFDNGAGLSWPLNVAPGQTAVFSHETFFSPLGRSRGRGVVHQLRSRPDTDLTRPGRHRPERGHHGRRDRPRAVPIGALQQHARGELRRGHGLGRAHPGVVRPSMRRRSRAWIGAGSDRTRGVSCRGGRSAGPGSRSCRTARRHWHRRARRAACARYRRQPCPADR